MNELRFSSIKVLIADSTQLSAITTRNLLQNNGMRIFSITHELAETREALAQNEFDLLVINSHLHDDAVVPLLRDVRQHDLGNNPFIPIIAMAWEPSVETVGHMMSGGVDVLLTLPLSVEKMDKALDHLIKRRKPFVVTADYIGPDRRKSVRLNMDQVPMMVVPNPVKRKVMGKDDAATHEAVLSAVYDQRVESYISRITFTIGKISGLIGDSDKGTMSNWLEELRVIASNLSYRISETSYAHQSALCRAMIDITDTIDKSGSLDASDLDLLQQIALALEIAVKKDDSATIHAALNIEQMIENTLVEKTT